MTAERSRMVALFAALVGVVLRVDAAMSRPPSADAYGFVDRARDWTPWGAGDREPVWVGVTKLLTGPFGYPVGATQVISVVCSVVALWLCWRLLVRFGPTAAVVAFTFVALHPLLITDAANGIREPAALALSALIARLLLDERAVAGVWVGVLFGIRWELGLAWTAVIVVGLLARRVDPKVLAAAVGVTVLLVGPFLVANWVEHGDPMHHSNRHAIYYRNLEDGSPDPYSLPRFRGEPITWTEYYGDFIGWDLAMTRGVHGAQVIPASVAGVGRVGVGQVVLLVLIAHAILRRTPVAVGSVVFLAAVTVGYAPLLGMAEPRLWSILVLPCVLLAGDLLRGERPDLHDSLAAARTPVSVGVPCA